MIATRVLGIAVGIAVGASIGGCGAAEHGPRKWNKPGERETWYRLSWHGGQVGWAVDRERPGRIERVEHVVMARGGPGTQTMDLEIDIDLERDLTPKKLRVTKSDNGHETVVTASRAMDGWRRDGETTVFAPEDAVPSELVPILVRTRGTFAGPVILSGWDLAVADGIVIPAGDRRYAARTVVGATAIDAAIEVDTEGNPVTIVDSSGTEAERTDEARATSPWEPIDVIEAGSIAIDDTTVPIEVALVAKQTPAPPPLPGQRVAVDGDRWRVTLDPAIEGRLPPGGAAKESYEPEIAAIAADVHAAISPSLDGNTATSGDCTAYAVAFAAYARVSGIPAQIVTGFVVDGSRLVRHRWDLAWTGTRWITVDASEGTTPTTTPRLGIAVGDETATGLTAAAMFDLRAP